MTQVKVLAARNVKRKQAYHLIYLYSVEMDDRDCNTGIRQDRGIAKDTFRKYKNMKNTRKCR